MKIEIRKPELEALIRERMESGVFQDVEDVLIDALKSAPVRKQTTSQRPRKKNFAEFLLESPLRGSGLKLERHRDYHRPAEL